MKRWTVGDIHGNYRGFKQALERSGFDYVNDLLVSLGDLADGYSELHLVMEELLKINNLVLIKGNHDEWFKEWMECGLHPQSWRQGGTGSFKSYLKLIGKPDMWQMKSSGGYICALNPADIPEEHKRLFRSQVKYWIDENNNLFVHGGFNRHLPLKGQDEHIYYWDRDLWLAALSYESMVKGKDSIHGKQNNQFKMKDDFNRIFIGHTSTINWGTTEPMRAANIINIDTGGGFNGVVTIMNIDDPKEYYQSDLSQKLYPDDKGRI